MIQYKELGLVAPHPQLGRGQRSDRIVATLAIVNLGHVLNETLRLNFVRQFQYLS